jgi:hypothetical protein
MPKAGKNSSGGGQKRTADDSSPAKSNRTQPANKKVNVSDKDKEIDLLKHQLNEQKMILDKMKNLNPEELAKHGISLNDLHNESETEDEKQDCKNSVDDEYNDISDNEMEINININDQDNEPNNEAEARKQEIIKKYFELEKQTNEYFIEFVELGGDQNLLLNNSEILRTKLNPSKDNREKKIFDHIIKLKVHDFFEYAEMDNFMREIKTHKGNVNIENAFLNRYNNLFYLCTNDPYTAEKLRQEWPKNAFNKGVEIVPPKAQRYFVAIHGVDVNINLDGNSFQKLCDDNSLTNIKRLTKKRDGTILRMVKAEVKDKDCYERMLKLGVKYGFFQFKVSKWIHNENQPLQSYKCLGFNHRQDQCKVPQKCLICSENHDFKQCPNKSKPKCANCQLPHAAVSKDCNEMKEETRKKQQSNINRISSRTNPKWSFSDVTKKNLNNIHETSNNSDTNNLLIQIVELLSKVLMPIAATQNVRYQTRSQTINPNNVQNV